MENKKRASSHGVKKRLLRAIVTAVAYIFRTAQSKNVETTWVIALWRDRGEEV
jgi:hypothetical protein